MDAAPIDPLDVESPGLTVLTVPVRGTGKLIFEGFDSPWEPKSARQALPTVMFKATPWAKTGVSPIAWQVTPGEFQSHAHPPTFGPPTVTLVCARSVALAWNPNDWNSGDAEEPNLNIVRVQNDALVPTERTRIAVSDLVREPYPWWATRADGAQPFSWWMMSGSSGRLTEWDATVRAFRNGVEFADDKGDWWLKIRVDLESRAGFAYEIQFPQDSGFFLYVVCTPNVKIEGFVTSDRDGGVSQLIVQRADVDLQDVPAQGSAIRTDRYRFAHVQLEIRLDAAYLRQIQAFESALFLLPLLAPNPLVVSGALIFALLGTLYEVANAAWTVTHGRTIWGETKELTHADLAFLGVSVALTLVPAYGGALAKSLKAVAKARLPAKFLGLFEGGLQNSMRATLDPRVVAAIEELSQQEQKVIARTLDALVKAGGSPATVVQAFIAALAKKVGTAAQVERVFLQVLSQDFNSFRIAELEEGFRKYVSKGGPLSALQWAAKQTVGRYADLLVRSIGPKYTTMLTAMLNARKVVTVSEQALALIAKVDGTFHHYRDFRNMTKGLGSFFEVDHLIEKRFLSSAQFEEMIHSDDFMSMIVAKNAQVARQIPKYTGYSHLEKTLIMRRLIPHGSEALVTAQQFWDAHAHALLTLGVDEKRVAAEFKREVQFLLRNSHLEGAGTVNYRVAFPADHFTRRGGWHIMQPVILK